jgi:ribosomal protein S27AE
MGKWTHRLTNKDFDLLTADCSECGPVDMMTNSNGARWSCGVKYRQSRDEINKRAKEARAAAKKLRQEAKKDKLHPIFNIPMREVEELKANRSCFICGSTERLAIDHDHKTGRLRGLLCMDHNTALGKFHDSIAELEKAIIYLKSETEFLYYEK